MRAADLMVKRLSSKYGIRHVSLVTGNGSLVINDAICQNKDITPVFFNGEQSASYFALGYSKYTNGLSFVNPIGGCGSTNCMTGLLAAWQDHVPILFLSGNVASNQTTHKWNANHFIKARKIGVQETDIMELVKPLTKYAAFIGSAAMSIYELDKAVEFAMTYPRGPVWLDLPSDVGSQDVSEKELLEYVPVTPTFLDGLTFSKFHVNRIKRSIAKAERPLVLAGNGVRLSGRINGFKQFVQEHQIPCVFTYGAVDIMRSSDPLNIGRIGIKGNRAANMAVNNCDLLIVLGASLNIPQVGYDVSLFAPKAEKIIIDSSSNLPGLSDLATFFTLINE